MLRIVGDINFTDGFFDTGFGVGSKIMKGEDPFQYLERDSKDIWFGNFECVAATTSNKEGIYRKQFIISPESLSHVKHLDYYNVANNHVMQHGDVAYKEMLEYIESTGSQVVGSLQNKSISFSHQGKSIGVVAFSQREEKYFTPPNYWYSPEYIEVEKEYQKISDFDFKIAYVHWGNEFIDRPYVDQKRFGRWLVDLGFDLIIGLHPHVLQGYEIYKEKYIFYSIGNFVFNMPLESTRYSAIISVDLEQQSPMVSFDYIHIGKDNFPSKVEPKDVPDKFKFDYLNLRLDLEQENELYYKEVFKFNKSYRKANYTALIKSINKFRFADILGIFQDFFNRRFR